MVLTATTGLILLKSGSRKVHVAEAGVRRGGLGGDRGDLRARGERGRRFGREK